jgi:predicted SAM-dependent methyltransferase
MLGLNLGSGEHGDVAGPHWVNVDRWDRPEWKRRPDVVANVLTGLPFVDRLFTHVYLGHFLEHLAYDEIPTLWKELRRVCVAGAPLRVVGPCVDKARALSCDSTWIATLAPAAEPTTDGLTHRWRPTTEATLEAVRLVDPEAFEIELGTVQPPDWPNPNWVATWQVAIAGVIGRAR